MAAEETKAVLESYPMNGGDGKVSYARNSLPQKNAVDASRKFVSEAISDLLDIEYDPISDSSFKIRIADLGCASGPNTFYAMQNIMETIDSKFMITHKDHKLDQSIEYQVFFNDQANNDFNTLFRSIPSPQRYFPVGVPGSFYGRLFPKHSIDLMHSSNSLNWLSSVPKDVRDIHSPAWNGDSIYCKRKEVVEAYSRQYKKDMENFLKARAIELVHGGLLILVTACVPNGFCLNQTDIGKDYEILGSCLVDMANKGLISKEKVESFNLPLYYASPSEIEKLIQDNGCFSIERMEKFAGNRTHFYDSEMWAMAVRAGFEPIIRNHFGDEMIEELFENFTKKHRDNVSFFKADDVITFVGLKIVLKPKN